MSSIANSGNNDSVILRAANVCFGYVHGKTTIDDASFSIKNGSKVTIMGQNGSGKSTIIKLLSGSLKPLSGQISISNNLAVATAQQVMSRENSKLTVYNFFQRHLQGNDKGIESRIAKVFQQVNLSVPLERTIESFSGGQQARLLLAAALIQDPDILLLDEPTNNLDISGVRALTQFIKSTSNTCIVISHDEDFLNSFTDSVLYIDNHSKKLECYQGNYNNVKKAIQDRIRKENSDNARVEKLAKQKKDQANQFANKGGNMRKVAKKLRETAEDLESKVIDVRKEDKSLRPFKIPIQPNLGSITSRILEMKTVSLPYKTRTYAFAQSNVTESHLRGSAANEDSDGEGGVSVELPCPIVLGRRSQLLIRGPNGIGKTTFLNSIVEASASGCKVPRGVTVGYYRQDFSYLDFNQTVLECLHEAGGGVVSEQEVRGVAAAFLISRHDITQKIGTLSEGQKGLVSFASLVLQQPSLLVVDEPTNHINFRHLPAIAQSLKSFEGALVLVSHDKNFVSSVNIENELDLGSLFGKT